MSPGLSANVKLVCCIRPCYMGSADWWLWPQLAPTSAHVLGLTSYQQSTLLQFSFYKPPRQQQHVYLCRFELNTILISLPAIPTKGKRKTKKSVAPQAVATRKCKPSTNDADWELESKPTRKKYGQRRWATAKKTHRSKVRKRLHTSMAVWICSTSWSN